MNDEQKIAYVNGQIACAQIEAMGMVADNAYWQSLGQAPAYTLTHFQDLIYKYGIHNNAIIEFFRD
jgi:hypothetical protein